MSFLPGNGRSRLTALGWAALGTLVLAAGPVQARMNLNTSETFGRGPQAVYCNREPWIYTHNVGLLTLQITNIGVIGNPWINELSAGWRGGEYLYMAGLWIGAIGEDAEPHVSTAVPVELRPSLLQVDHIYESYEGVKGGLRSGFFNGDDDGDGLTDEDFQNGKDDDGDGLIDEDFAAIGQQMFSCEYWDNSAEAIAQINDHKPLGIKVRQRSFEWSSPKINEFVGFDFQLINIGDQRLKNVYIGFFVDADAGPKTASNYWTDDLVGYARIDTMALNSTKTGECAREHLSMDICYIWDAPDNGTTIAGGDVPGYFGGMFLGHTIDAAGIKAPKRVGLTTVKWTAATGAYPQGDPRTDYERYDLLSKGEVPSGAKARATKPDDYRFTYSAGPFAELDPGDELSFQTAFVIGEGFDGMVENAVSAQRIFNGQFVDADKNPDTGVDGKEFCLKAASEGEKVTRSVKCDTILTTYPTEQPSWGHTYCYYLDDDCNLCTGVDGKEFLLNWVGSTAPPPPLLNTDPDLQSARITNPESEVYLESPSGDRKVILQWDNISELRPDPITGKNVFEGYRIWRVDNWQRPEGSVGPTPEQWMLINEFRLHPRDKLGVLSPHHLRAVTRKDRWRCKEPPADSTSDCRYYVGRYEWADTNGIINGKVYFYSVTAFGVDTTIDPITKMLDIVELTGSPAAVQKEVIVASWPNGGGCSDIRVVPNPYRGGADWDLQKSDCDPTGTKIAFRNLPNAWERINIYTLTGDLVLSAVPSDSRVLGGCDVSIGDKTQGSLAGGTRPSGTFYWDLITRSGQNVVAGVYLYVVETGNELCRGRFVIIR